MRELIERHDWSASPLGLPSGWSPALRATVNLILDSRFAMCLAWGKELGMIYNQGYAEILGPRHPAALGCPAAQVWADSWHELQPLVDQALAGQSVYFQDQPLKVIRGGHTERVWFTYSFSPLRNDDGRPAGVLCICTETTGKVLNERRQSFRIEVEDRLRHVLAPEEVMQVTTELLGKFMRVDRAGFAELQDNGKELLFGTDWTNGKVPSLDGQSMSLSQFHPALVSQLEAGRTVSTEDVLRAGFIAAADSSASNGNGDPYAHFQVQAAITVPLIRDGVIAGVFYVHNAVPRRWRADEELLVREIAERAWDAIKRCRAERAQRDSEQRFRNMADHTPVMIWATAPNGACTYLNPAWYRFTGQSEAEALGLGWLEVTHPDDKAETAKNFATANSARKPFRAEYRLRRQDGSYRWVVDAAAPRFDTDGTFLGYVGSVLDIDELKTAETALIASNARFRAAIDAVEGVLWTNDAAGRMVGEQPGWSVLTGQSAAEYQGYGWVRAVHPEDAAATLQAWQQAVAERRHFVYEHRLRRHDGQWRHYSIRAVPSLDRDGSILEWIGVHTDITELRHTEESLRRLNAGLEIGIRESTRERDRLWRMSQDIMAIGSIHGHFVSVNPAFTAALGWTEEEATSIPISEMTHPDHREGLAGRMALLRQGMPLVRYEVRDLHKDGSFRWLSWTVVPEGDLLYGVARDITQEKQQAEALRQTEEALRQAQKMEAVGQLTGGIAHDFNNLLGGLVGNLELMRMRLSMGNTADLGRYVDGAMAMADRAAALTHRLLAFSRRQTLDPKPVHVNHLVNSMTEIIRRAVGPAVHVDAALDEELWTTRCDPNQLESALLNLAINARDAMPQGGRLLIETHNMVLDANYARLHPDVAPGQYAAISVTDTGIGMSPEIVARAFDPFFTTKPLGQGTGLGLSMIYGFVKQSGGHVSLHSQPGLGTRITLKLPRYTGTENQETDGAPSQSATAAATKATLLIVDDEAALRTLLAEALEMRGYRTVQAGDAAQALRMLHAGQMIDLLVTDVGLPGGMNGRQLAEAARSLYRDLRILFITGYAEDVATRDGALEPGMQVMTKPFGLEAFAARVGAMLDVAQEKKRA